jgi:hypothetical protein
MEMHRTKGEQLKLPWAPPDRRRPHYLTARLGPGFDAGVRWEIECPGTPIGGCGDHDGNCRVAEEFKAVGQDIMIEDFLDADFKSVPINGPVMVDWTEGGYNGIVLTNWKNP